MAGVDERKVLRDALRQAVDGEIRFGRLDSARPDLDLRWDRVIDELVQCLKTSKKSR